MRTKRTAVRSRTARIGVVVAVTAAGLVGTATPSFALPTPAVLTSPTTQGPSGGGNTISLSVPVPIPAVSVGFAATATFVEFQYVGTLTAPAYAASTPLTPALGGTVGCWPSYLAGITPAVVSASATVGVVVAPPTGAKATVIFPPNKLYVTVPNGLALAPDPDVVAANPSANPPVVGSNGPLVAQTSAKYNICVYSGNTPGASGSPLIAQTGATTGQYSIANKAAVSSVTPPTGPAQGKTLITVGGANFTTPATMTATLGGAPLAIATVNDAGTSFTANVPSHTASATPVDLVVTTSGGTIVAPGVFTYTNGIVALPDNEPNTQAPLSYINIQGVGFAGLTFGTGTAGVTPDGTGAHVYLVNGTYSPVSVGSPAHKKVGETAECIDVRVVSDTEIVCSPYPGVSVDPTTGTTATATHTLKVGYAVATASGLKLTPVAPDTFTAADQGLLVTGTDLAAGTLITTVDNAGVASIDTIVGGTGVAQTITVSARPFIATTTTDSANLTVVTTTTGTPTAFATYDVGRVVTGAGVTPVPYNTTLFSQATAAGVLTAAIPGTGATTVPMFIGNAAPVPTGVYTVTVVSDGSLGSTTYTQSIISSGSTYTVAPY